MFSVLKKHDQRNRRAKNFTNRSGPSPLTHSEADIKVFLMTSLNQCSDVKNGFLISGNLKQPVSWIYSSADILKVRISHSGLENDGLERLKREYQNGTARHKFTRFEGPFCEFGHICIVRGEHLLALVGAGGVAGAGLQIKASGLEPFQVKSLVPD